MAGYVSRTLSLAPPLRDNGRAPDPVLNFDGAASDGTVPPDTNGDVGPNHYVQAVNAFAGTTISVYDKSGTALSQFSLNDLWTGSGRPCEGYGYGDPIVLYDSLADRWILTEFALPTGSGTPPWYLCIAVSQTPDPTGAYNLYDFAVSDNFPDYPKYAAWHDAYYMCANEWPVGIYAFDRTRMLAGLSATFQSLPCSAISCCPATSTAPPRAAAGAPNYFYTMMDDTGLARVGISRCGPARNLDLRRRFCDPRQLGRSPKPSTFQLRASTTTRAGFSWEVVPQLGTTQRVDAIGEWPMWRLQYRNFGTHETLVGNFAVDVDGAGLVGIRWFELRKSGLGTWAIHQEGTHSPDTDHRWMGSVAMDGFGNIALGYSVSSATMHPAIRYAVRTAADPAGALGTETTLIAGPGSQSGTDRWGDYSSMSVDPADERTFWYTNEYIDTGGMWRTRIGTFQVDMTPPDTPTASSASLVLSDGFTANWSAAAGATTYLLDVSTDAGFATFVPGYNGLNVGNVTAAPGRRAYSRHHVLLPRARPESRRYERLFERCHGEYDRRWDARPGAVECRASVGVARRLRGGMADEAVLTRRPGPHARRPGAPPTPVGDAEEPTANGSTSRGAAPHNSLHSRRGGETRCLLEGAICPNRPVSPPASRRRRALHLACARSSRRPPASSSPRRGWQRDA